MAKLKREQKQYRERMEKLQQQKMSDTDDEEMKEKKPYWREWQLTERVTSKGDFTGIMMERTKEFWKKDGLEKVFEY